MASSLEQWELTVDPGYEVSSFGNVRSLSRFVQCGPKTGNGTRLVGGLVLKPFISKTTGYLQVALSKKKRFNVHRLVAFAFCDGYFDGAYVNHKNGIRNDNRSENLEWCTQSENNLHAFRQLRRKPTALGKFGKDHPTSKPIKMQSFSTGEVEFFDSALEAVRKYPQFDSGSISRCCSGKSKSHKGYGFSFVSKNEELQSL